MTTPSGSNITHRNFPYGTTINFVASALETVRRPDPYDDSKTVELPVPERAIRNHLTQFHGFREGVHFVVKHVPRPPCAAIPMHPEREQIKHQRIRCTRPFLGRVAIGTAEAVAQVLIECAAIPMDPNRDQFKQQRIACTRLFIGRVAIGTAEAVAQVLIECANEMLGDVTDPIAAVHVNTCQPHFLIRCYTQACFTAVCVFIGQKRWQHVADADNLSVQVMFVHYSVAVMTPRDMDALLRDALPGHQWSVTKRTGGLQLVMLPHHATRLLALCGRCAQDTDGNLVVAQTHAVAVQMSNFMNNYSDDCARQMCLPMRFVSIEKRK